MINKKSNSSGACGGHGMREFSVDYLKDCELYHEYKSGHSTHCPYCGEEYHLDPSLSFVDALSLNNMLQDDGCPFCNNQGELTSEYLDWFMEYKKKVIQFNFELANGKAILTYRKPLGWKPISKAQLKVALEVKEAEKN